MSPRRSKKQQPSSRIGIPAACFIVVCTIVSMSSSLGEKAIADASLAKSTSSAAEPVSSQQRRHSTSFGPHTSPDERASNHQTSPAGDESNHYHSGKPRYAELHASQVEAATTVTRQTGYSVSTSSSLFLKTSQASKTLSQITSNYQTLPATFPVPPTTASTMPSSTVLLRKRTMSTLSTTSELVTASTSAGATPSPRTNNITSIYYKSEIPKFNSSDYSDEVSPSTNPAENLTFRPSNTVTSDESCEPVHQFITGMAGAIEWEGPQGECLAPWTYQINVPKGYGIIVKFHRVELKSDLFIEFNSVQEGDKVSYNVTNRNLSRLNSLGKFDPLIVYEHELKIVVNIPDDFYEKYFGKLKVSFRAHPLDAIPVQIYTADSTPRESRRKYGCFAEYGVNIPEAFKCDKIQQCIGGEDEANCTYREEGCGDWVPYRDKCLKITFVQRTSYIPGHTHVTMPHQAEEKCRSEYDAELAILPDAEGIDMVNDMIRQSGFFSATIGIKKFKPSSVRLKHLYKYTWQWGGLGGPLAYQQQTIQRDGPLLDCGMLSVFPSTRIIPIACVLPSKLPAGYVCMRINPTHSKPNPPAVRAEFHKALLSPPENFRSKQCPDGSFVQTFHPCKWDDEVISTSVDKFPFFQCRFGPSVHYTLVCDGAEDCADGSDEIACAEPKFPPLTDTSFMCQKFQLVPLAQRCNGVPDCMDDSDENYCSSCGIFLSKCPGVGCVPDLFADFFDTCPLVGVVGRDSLYPFRPAVVHLNGFGWSLLKPTHENCTEGQFKCHDGLCIPSYLINNGEKDCFYGEDENIAKENVKCPGYYRCQDFGMCIHPEFLCDGIYHCPNKDDEKYCHMSCPSNCTCEGYAYSCRATFNPHQHLQVRYLDLSGTENPGLFLRDVHVMEFLRFLNLSSCALSNVTLRDMTQLNILDMSHNHLTELSSLNLSGLTGVTWLDLSGNSFVLEIDSTFAAFVTLAGLKHLKTLALTNTDLVSIADRAFSSLTKLTTLDLRSNRLEEYGSEIFWGIKDLQVLHTDDQKLCCQYFHQTPLQKCDAPVDELSSCKDLLQSDFFRVFLWLLAVLAMTGNAGVLIYRMMADEKNTPPAFRVLVKNLCASDFLMGVYMMIIGAADVQFRNKYVEEEADWRHSVACKVAGVLAFLSSEVSAFVICLITLDRLLVICFPLKSRLHLESKSATITCGCLWVTCLVLAVVPLIVGLEFYNQNGICLPLPITRHQFSGQLYAFSIFVVLNFLLFVLIGGGQMVIYRAVREAGTAVGTHRRQQEMIIARRLFLVVFTDFCCWFPVGVMGLLAASGTAIPGEVNVWVAIFVMPLNSALNPFLYTLNGALEKWERRRMEVRTRRMFARLHAELPKWQPNTVEELMRICIRSKLVKREKVLLWLGPARDSEVSPERRSQHKETHLTTREGMSTSCDFVSDQDITLGTNVELNTESDGQEVGL